MNPNPDGHIARARKLGISPNRTLVRDAVAVLLKRPGQPCYVVYDGHRLAIREARPALGVWAQVGPYESYVPLDTLTREMEFIAANCRERAEKLRA